MYIHYASLYPVVVPDYWLPSLLLISGKGSFCLFTFGLFVLLFVIVFGFFCFSFLDMGPRKNRRCGDVASSSSLPSVTDGRNVRRRLYRWIDSLRALPEYVDCGDCDALCSYCGAFF